MNLLDSFNVFYSNLSSNGLFFFWIVVFLFDFLVFLLIVLVVKNKRLLKLLGENQNSSNTQNISILENAKKEESPIVEEFKEEEKKENIVQEEIKIEEKEEPKKEVEISEDKIGPYKKNILREMSARTQTSPIHIERNINNIENNNVDTATDISSTILKEDNQSPLEMMEDSYEINDSMKFASEIVAKMEEEIKPSNIELTDYEKKQEEEAIISYDELLKVKDKIYNITEDEETDEFIDELKSFRLDLQ